MEYVFNEDSTIMASASIPIKEDFVPSFWQTLLQPLVQTIVLTGCGGDFDFCHSMLLYPALIRAGKRIVVGNYSFGDPNRIKGM